MSINSNYLDLLGFPHTRRSGLPVRSGNRDGKELLPACCDKVPDAGVTELPARPERRQHLPSGDQLQPVRDGGP